MEQSLSNFLLISVITSAIILCTSIICYEILRTIWMRLPRLTIHPRLRALVVAASVFAVHIINIWIYGVAYFLIENFTTIGKLIEQNRQVEWSFEAFLDCLYFSAATYTSLGLGDIVPTDHLRMLAGAEVLNGLVLIGCSISFAYLSMQDFWQLPHRRKSK